MYMYSPSRSPLPPPSPPDPSGSSQCTRSEHLSHASNLGWWSLYTSNFPTLYQASKEVRGREKRTWWLWWLQWGSQQQALQAQVVCTAGLPWRGAGSLNRDLAWAAGQWKDSTQAPYDLRHHSSGVWRGPAAHQQSSSIWASTFSRSGSLPQNGYPPWPWRCARSGCMATGRWRLNICLKWRWFYNTGPLVHRWTSDSLGGGLKTQMPVPTLLSPPLGWGTSSLEQFFSNYRG